MAATDWPVQCHCESGSFENGWHEIRSQRCLDVERAQWSEAARRTAEWLQELRVKHFGEIVIP
jgi:hypothetical protein